jgi:AcrR family transcriptional regulator
MTRMSLQDRRAHIVAAALRVALREGLDKTTVRAIAAEGSVSLGVLHYCFDDKAEIVRQLAQALSEHTLTLALDALAVYDGGENPVGPYAALLVADPAHHLLTFEITVAALRDPELAGVADAQNAARLSAAGRFIDRLVEQRGGRLDRDSTARWVISQLDAATLSWLVSRDDDVLRADLLRTWTALLDRMEPAPTLGVVAPPGAGTLHV